ncbi:MAG: hypothetical protein ACXW25_05155, partial [Rhodospirillales bacterium]
MLGLAVLAGWAWDITVLKTVLPGLVAMQPWAAHGFAVGGLALVAASLRGWMGTVARVVASLLLLAVAGQALLAYAGLDLGSDTWLFAEALRNQPGYAHPGRVAVVTAIAMACLAAVLLLACDRRRLPSILFSLIASVGLFLIAVPLVAYLFGLHT